MTSRPLRPRRVVPRSLAQLASGSLRGARLDPVDGEAAITGITLNSRTVESGDLYAALPGARTHGARFAQQAEQSGAAAVLTDLAGLELLRSTGCQLPAALLDDPRAVVGPAAAEVYGHPSQRLRVLGVTGTNGKTTTAYLMDSILRTERVRTGLVGTVETRIGEEVLPSERTTPEAPDLQSLLAVMVDRDVQAVAMEVSSHALALGRVDGVRFSAAVFTNLSQDHLDFHADLEDYFAAKAKLFTPERSDIAVINLDDPYGERLMAGTPLPVTTYSAAGDPRADWRAVSVETSISGSRVVVAAPDGQDATVDLRLVGAFNVANALAALAATVSTGTDLGDAVRGLSSVGGVPGRMQRIEAGQPFLALVDYAHTPEAVGNLLATLRPLTAGRLVVVLGCGGDRDTGKRPLMGQAASAGADLVVLTTDNPRSEDPTEILEQVRAGAALGRAEVRVEPDRSAAIALAVRGRRPGDCVVVAGKGHETGQERNGAVTPFDDREVLRAALEELA